MSDILEGQVYPFDPTGIKPSNLVKNEQHIITLVNWRDYHFIVPRFAPYFLDGLLFEYIDLDGNRRELIEGKDWYPTHQFISGGRACGKPIYGSISFLDTTLTGLVVLKQYQTLGGVWAQDEAKIAEILADKIHNPRTTSWDVVIDMPYSFPPIDHEWDLIDLVGEKEVVAAIAGVEAAIRYQSGSTLDQHLTDFSNPHQVTKWQVELGNVLNYATATKEETLAGTADNLYTTPKGVAFAIQGLAIEALNAHALNRNAHNTRPSDLSDGGAYNKLEVNQLLDDLRNSGLTANDTSRFGGQTTEEYRTYVLTGTADNALHFNGYTKDEFLFLAAQGKSADSDKLAGKTLDEVKAYVVPNNTVDNSIKLNGKQDFEIINEALQGTAANANTLGGQSVTDIYSTISAEYTSPSGAAKQITQDEYDPGSYTGLVWWKVAEVSVLPYQGEYDTEVQVLISGGDSRQANAYGSIYLTVSARNGVEVKATKLNNFDLSVAKLKIGFIIPLGLDVVQVYVSTASDLNPLAVTQLSKNNGMVLIRDATPLQTEPAGLSYITVDHFVTRTELDSVIAALP